MSLAKDLSSLPRPAATKADGWAPDPEPRFVQVLAERWQQNNDEAGPKPRAFPDARFRHSDAGACARKVALAALDTPDSDPMDMTGVHNTSLGTVIHELWQEALADRYPDALIEPKVRSVDGAGAGHIDAVIYLPGGDHEVTDDPTDRRTADGHPDGVLAVDRSDDRGLRRDQDRRSADTSAPGDVRATGRTDRSGDGAGPPLPEPGLLSTGTPGGGDPEGEHASGRGTDSGERSGDDLHARSRDDAGEHARVAERPSSLPGVRPPEASGVPAQKVISFELKTIGGFGFKMAVGERGAAQGPKWEHQVQSALNAKAVDADESVIGYLSKEAISVAAAKRKGFSELGRMVAEWTMTREQYLPMAEAEEARVAGILDLLDAGTLPARKIPSPELPSGAVIVDPKTGRWEVRAASVNDNTEFDLVDTGTFWACGYCRYQTLCIDMPSGRCSVDEVPVELRGAA